MARRLVEAGVEIVTTTFDGELCGRVANWDDHAVNHHVFDALKFRLPFFDQAVTALIEDIHVRGLDRRVLVVVTGEFGRTPKINGGAGRDHWAPLSTLALAGGGLKMGQVIGESTAKAETPKSKHYSPQDLMATVFHVLGIPQDLHYTDPTGRPSPMLNGGVPVPELV
jgi:uncharacterized protein (DUF1501 family)